MQNQAGLTSSSGLRVAGQTRTDTRKPSERRLQILQALAAMLEEPGGERVTTAALARRLEVSEAALYRHFSGKAQMFEGLIDFIEQSLLGLINQILATEEDGLRQVRMIMHMLLEFAEANRGMTRVLVGDALIVEDDRLQQRMNQLMDRIEASLRQSLKVAAAQQSGHAIDAQPMAQVLIAFILGIWLRFAKTEFRRLPLEDIDIRLAWLLR